MGKKLIGQILLERNQINESQLNDALRWKKSHPNDHLAYILYNRGIITFDILLSAYAEKLGTQYYEKDLKLTNPQVLKLVPESLARKYGIMPLDIVNNRIIIATSQPRDLSSVEDVKISSKLSVDRVFASDANIESAIEKYYKNVDLLVSNIEEDKTELITTDNTKKLDEIDEAINNTPVVKLVNSLIQQAYMRKSSDIHIEPFEKETVIRIRIDGDLVETMRLAASSLSPIISRIKILSGMNIAEKRIPQDGRYEFKFADIKVDLRVSTIPTIYGEKCVMRLLNTGGDDLLTFDKLGMTDDNIKKFERIVEAPNGIILVTGPTGSGKSTTLYAVLNRLNKPNVNLTTIEDPVEKQMFGVNQCQVNQKAGMTFASGLRSLLRQDPDVIMIGEIRDYETAEIATRAALTGHLVLSTLHTNDSIATIMRLTDMGIPGYMVSASVNAIIAQRLIKRLCPACKKSRPATETEKKILNDPKLKTTYHQDGCSDCNYTGYKGRIAIHEIFELTHEVRSLVSKSAPLEEIRKIAEKQGIEFLSDNLRKLVQQGVTSMDEYQKLIYTIE